MESELGAVLLGFTGARSSFGASSSQVPRPPPQTTPRPAPTRPPVTTTVRPGTGFSPFLRVGPASRTCSAKGQAPFRSSRIHAAYTVDVSGDSDSDVQTR